MRDKKISIDINKLELMRTMNNGINYGSNIHIYLRELIPSRYSVSNVDLKKWEAFRNNIEKNHEWKADNRLIWDRQLTNGKRTLEYIVYLEDGVTIERSQDGIIELFFDARSDGQTVESLKTKLDQLNQNDSTHEIGFIQSGMNRLTVKFCNFKSYRHNLIPYMGEEIREFYDRTVEQLNSPGENGLYLLYGVPGTGKTSFIKQVLTETDKEALFITPAFTEKLTSPELISLLMDYPDSILIIEDAETVLMKREADNSSAVSNLLNLSDGFPADFLNLNIFCTFNTDLNQLDPALLREGRLKGMQEFTKLEPARAQQIAKLLGKQINPEKSMTVAEICADKSTSHDLNPVKIGFDSSTIEKPFN